ncbi:MAG: alkaline phosphatase [Bacteroidales bacterium]|nr:alkaline phosphatase [Bacteroidales bacterium]MBD5235332.1 alkaline phosphatase [Barnesiella sp.]MBD5247532.1 alkaline phosphatase [Barnesiella sp.]
MKKSAILRNLLAAVALLFTLSLSAKEAKYIFYFIGDGMGPGQVMFGDLYKRAALGDSLPLNMLQLPVHSIVTTYSASSPVTDSAAAGTALATGSKTKNSMLGMNADTVAVYSVAKHLHDKGYGVALMTNSAADDATPGAFYAHVPNRGHFYDIGRQAAESGYELICGAALRGKNQEMVDYIAAQGVELLDDPAAAAASDSRRIILIPTSSKWDWDMGYQVDNNPGEMSVNDMTVMAINHLKRHTPKKFFMMIEGGSIDHLGHSNDGGGIVKEVVAFDEAIATALDFYRAHPDETLIIVTADHETGGLTVGNNYTGYNANPQYLVHQKMSKEVFSAHCDELMNAQNKPTWEEMKQYLTDNFGFFTEIPMSQRREDRLHEVFNLTFIDGQSRRQETLYSNFNQFAVEVFEMLNDKAGCGWTTRNHSGNMVPLFAIGVGADLFKGLNDNTDVPKKILQAAKVKP